MSLDPMANPDLAAAAREFRELLVGRCFRAFAHTINNPLQSALGGIELLQMGVAVDEPDAGPELLDQAHGGVRRAGRLVESMQILARLEPGEPAYLGIDVTEVVFPAFRILADHRRVDIDWPPEGDCPAADGGGCALALLGWLEAACRSSMRSYRLDVFEPSSQAGSAPRIGVRLVSLDRPKEGTEEYGADAATWGVLMRQRLGVSWFPLAERLGIRLSEDGLAVDWPAVSVAAGRVQVPSSEAG